VKKMVKGLLSFLVTGVFTAVALMVWGWWFILWVFLGAVLLIAIGETLKEMSLIKKEQR